MRAARRNLLIAGLAAASGSLDAWSYFGLAHLFIVNMTGNTVLLGFSLTAARWTAAAGNAASILSYGSGVMLGTLLAKPISQAVHEASRRPDIAPWPKRLQLLLCLESALVAVAVGLDLLYKPVMEGLPAHILVCLGAVAVGVQSAAMVALEVPGVVTTYITGTWTTLAAGIVQLWKGAGTVSKERTRLDLQAVVLLAYLLAAAGSGLVFRTGGHRWMGLLPLMLLCGVLVASLAWQGETVSSAS